MDDEFDFRIVGTVRELERLIRARAGEGSTARLVAGFCWPWSDPDDAGELEPDVMVGAWAMPWNAKAEAHRLGPGIPKSDFSASAKDVVLSRTERSGVHSGSSPKLDAEYGQ